MSGTSMYFFALTGCLAIPISWMIIFDEKPFAETGTYKVAIVPHDCAIEVVTMNPLIILRADANGSPINVIFDTGTRTNILDTSLERILSGTIRRNEEVKSCHSDNLLVGTLKSFESWIELIDLSMVNDEIDSKVSGIVGSPFTFGRTVHLDFHNKKFSLVNQSRESWETSRDIEFDQHIRPYVQLRLGSEKRYFLIDTGFTGALCVSRKTYEEFKKQDLIAKESEVETIIYRSNFEVIPRMQIELNNFDFLGYEFDSISAIVTDSVDSIGVELLSRFDVLIDYKNQKLKLRRSNRSKKPLGSGVVPKTKLEKTASAVSLAGHRHFDSESLINTIKKRKRMNFSQLVE